MIDLNRQSFFAARNCFDECVLLENKRFCDIISIEIALRESEGLIMKRMLSLIMCCAFLLSSVGCFDSMSEEESKVGIVLEEDEDVGPLQVYCLDYPTSNIVRPYIKQFKNEVEITTFESIAELEEALKGSGKPDVILLDGYVTSEIVNPFKWVKEGYLRGMSPYFAADESYDEENYVNGIMDAGRYDGEVYMVPLTISGQFLLANSEEVESGGLIALQDSYSMDLIMETMINDIEKHVGEKYSSQLIRNFNYSHTSQWLYACLEQTGAMYVDRDSKTVTIDEELFKLTVKYYKAAYQDVNAWWENSGDDYYKIPVADLENITTAFLGSGNMVFDTAYISSAYHQLLDQDVVLFPFEMTEGGHAFAADIVGMVSSQSKQPAKACAFLKELMDMSHENWEVIMGADSLRTMTPVNQNELEELIVSYETLFGTPYEMQHQAFEREKLPKDLADQLRQVYVNTKKVFIMDVDVLNILNMHLKDYVEGNTDNLEGVSEQIKTDIEAIL